MGFGLPETVSYYDMLFVIGRIASSGSSTGGGEVGKDVGILKEKMSKVIEEKNVLKQKVAALEKGRSTAKGKGKESDRVTGEFGSRKHANGQLITCFLCGGKGHFQGECPEAKDEPEDE